MTGLLSSRRVAVVVPNWNGAAFITRTLTAVLAQTRPADRVVVVDNASTDDSCDVIARELPSVEIVRLPSNTGFAGGANAGLAAVDTDLVAVLNSDARPAPDWLEQLLAQPDDPKVWAWGSVLVGPDGAVESAADHYDRSGYATKLGRGAQIADLPQTPYAVFAPPGACPLLRREVVQSLGGYCERFFLYYEDVDLAFRAALAGHRAVVVPAARVEHDLGRSSGGSPRPWFYVGRNSLWCAVRCLPDVTTTMLWRRTWTEWRTLRRRGGGNAYLRGRAAAVRGLVWALRARRAIRTATVVDPAELWALLDHPPLPRDGVRQGAAA
jgi:GT2 family glycosyltransferase